MPDGKVGAKKNLYRLVKVSRQLALPTAPGLLPVLTATAVKLLPFGIADIFWWNPAGASTSGCQKCDPCVRTLPLVCGEIRSSPAYNHSWLGM
jgi:hypothetical protein